MSFPTDWTDEIREVYGWADSQVSSHSPVCRISGRCCRFREFGHSLFLSHLEARILLDGAPLTLPEGTEFDDTGCPYQVNGMCQAREARPLACRVYFCDPSFQQAMPTILEEGLSRLKSIADRHGLNWCYAPLHHFLDGRYAAKERIPPPRNLPSCEPSSPTRSPLPLV